MKIKEFFQDGTGQYSSLRLVFLLWFFALVGLWIFACIHDKKIVPFDGSIVSLTGLILAGKVGQSVSENFSPNPPIAPAPAIPAV